MNSKSTNGLLHDSKTGSYCGTQDGRWVKSVKEYVKELDYGEVTLTVHNGHVVQVQKTEKIRF
ncbi:YezD family protein [Pontiellaceae bacterium B12219]|nr:YezD family protein [Pontiellaceae bacterium B12219]